MTTAIQNDSQEMLIFGKSEYFNPNKSAVVNTSAVKQKAGINPVRNVIPIYFKSDILLESKRP